MPRKRKAPGGAATSTRGGNDDLIGGQSQHTSLTQRDNSDLSTGHPREMTWRAEKARQETFHVAMGMLGGRAMVSVRVFRTARNGQEFPVPGRGFAVDPDRLAGLNDALGHALRECEERGLIKTVARQP